MVQLWSLLYARCIIDDLARVSSAVIFVIQTLKMITSVSGKLAERSLGGVVAVAKFGKGRFIVGERRTFGGMLEVRHERSYLRG